PCTAVPSRPTLLRRHGHRSRIEIACAWSRLWRETLVEIEAAIFRVTKKEWAEKGRLVEGVGNKEVYRGGQPNSLGAWLRAGIFLPGDLEKSRTFYRRVVVQDGVDINLLDGIPKAVFAPFGALEVWRKIPSDYKPLLLSLLKDTSKKQAEMVAGL